jgi:hypothetical protein
MKRRHPTLVLFLLHAVYFYIHSQQSNYPKITAAKSLSEDVATASSTLSQLKFEHLNANDGRLSYNKVQCILQDKQGYIWFGTVSGLNRYDGYIKSNSNNDNFQFWQQDNHPVQLTTPKFTHQKLDYIHNNPVVAGYVDKPEEYSYSSARDYYGTGKGLLNIILIDPLLITYS